jgi:hypothetical protein
MYKVNGVYRKPPNSGPGHYVNGPFNTPGILSEISHNVPIFGLFSVPGLYAKFSRTIHIMSHHFIIFNYRKKKLYSFGNVFIL